MKINIDSSYQFKFFVQNFLELEDFILEDIEQKKLEDDTECFIFTGHLKRKEHICPRCGNRTREVKDIREQTIRDLNLYGKKVFIKLKKQRYICPKCKKSFYEENDFLGKYQRSTKRLLAKIFEKLAEVNSFSQVARELNYSVSNIIRKFDYISYPEANLKNLEVLSIDEFKGNTGCEKYNCIIADPKNRVVLDILPKRYSNFLTSHFVKITREDRLSIKYFVSDMWKPYKDLAETLFKNTTFIVDKYHWIRQVIWAFENIRKMEQKKFYKYR